jgi:hypothetical protein
MRLAQPAHRLQLAQMVQHLAYRWGRHADGRTGVYAAPYLSVAPSATMVIVDTLMIDTDWPVAMGKADGSIHRASASKLSGSHWRTAGLIEEPISSVDDANLTNLDTIDLV